MLAEVLLLVSKCMHNNNNECGVMPISVVIELILMCIARSSIVEVAPILVENEA